MSHYPDDVVDVPYVDLSTDEEDAIGNLEDTFWHISSLCTDRIDCGADLSILRKNLESIIASAEIGLLQVEDWRSLASDGA